MGSGVVENLVACFDCEQVTHNSQHMAEAVDTIVEGTQQPCNCESLPERGAADKCFGGVGNTTTGHLAETSDCRKRPGGSSPAKVIVQYPVNVRFALEVLMLILNGLVGFVNYVVHSLRFSSIVCAIMHGFLKVSCTVHLMFCNFRASFIKYK